MATVDELQEELAKLRAQVASNEEKHRSAQRRELRLLRAEDLATLFAELTTVLRASAGLDNVSLVIADPDHVLRHLMVAAGTPHDDNPDLIVVDSLAGLAPQFVAFRKPWLGPYARCDHQLVFAGKQSMLGSVAMIPIRARGHLVGSVNLGSADGERFTPDLASDFLARFGIIAGCCLENVTNRARLMRSGFTDALTGWHNRRYLKLRLNEELARVSQQGCNLVCMMLDLDYFKSINDTWGHVAGDAVLREVAQRIESQVRTSDVTARYGGEEFIVLLPDTDREDAIRLAERIRDTVARSPIELPGGAMTTVTASIGVADLAPDGGSDDLKSLGESLVARADVALYTAKSEGRDRVVVAAA
jgi:diguanylate cyclase (GGDEF)-like protein